MVSVQLRYKSTTGTLECIVGVKILMSRIRDMSPVRVPAGRPYAGLLSGARRKPFTLVAKKGKTKRIKI